MAPAPLAFTVRPAGQVRLPRLMLYIYCVYNDICLTGPFSLDNCVNIIKGIPSNNCFTSSSSSSVALSSSESSSSAESSSSLQSSSSISCEEMLSFFGTEFFCYENKIYMYMRCGTQQYNPTKQFCDTRDNKIYKWVKIGEQVWMAENLNHNVVGSKCGTSTEREYGIGYKLSDTNTTICDTYGRLYNRATAMSLPDNCNSSSCASQLSAKHSGVCPSGWHIPSIAEWSYLVLDGINSGTRLKSTSGWNGSGNGTDDYGFSALPGGEGSSGGGFYDVGDSGYWWTSMENGNNYGLCKLMLYRITPVGDCSGPKSDLRSVRCLQD